MPETFTSAAAEELIVVDRNGFIESRHSGSAVVVDAAGDTLLTIGDALTPVFPRSSLKPFQAIASMQLGVPLRGAEVALACASHVGSVEHMDLAAKILHKAGLSETDLRCPDAWPRHVQSRNDMIRSGAQASKLAFNCSGKHSAFLWACTENGWDTESYLDPAHPVQQRVVEVIEDYAGEKLAFLAVDGCGAPAPALSLTGLARAFSRLAQAPGNKSADARAATVATAMLDYPWAVHGHGEENTVVMEDLGVLAKLGAEGVLGMAAPNGTAVAVKMLDGNTRGTTLLGLKLLAQYGAIPAEALEPVLAKVLPPIMGGGAVVGSVRLAAPVLALLD